jgi:hypothetical protein
MTPFNTESRTYVSERNLAWQGIAFIAGGVVFLGILFVRFLLLIAQPERRGDNMLPGIIGGVSTVGIGLIARGMFLLKTTRHVLVDSRGVELHTYISRRLISWREIGHIETDKATPFLSDQTHQVLRLMGTNGKVLAIIADTVGEFDELAADITQRSSEAAGQPTYDPCLDEQRRTDRIRKKQRKAAILSALLFLGMLGGLILGINEEWHTRQYATQGVKVDAKVVRRWMTGSTGHIEFSFKDAGGQTFQRDAMVEPGADWDLQDRSRTVPVEYLRSNPSWNRLVGRQESEPSFGGKFLLLTGGGTLMFGLLFLATFLGYDIRTENGVTALTRHGQVLKVFGASRGAPVDVSSDESDDEGFQ